MPITLANPGEEAVVRHVGGNPELRQHLADLGFVVGENVTVLSVISGNVIVKVKESRVAIDKAMAQKIMV